MTVVIWLVVGAAAGALAAALGKGRGFGVIGGMIVGVLGAMIASWLLPSIGFAPFGGAAGEIIDAVFGAAALLALAALRKAPPRRSVFMGFRPR